MAQCDVTDLGPTCAANRNTFKRTSVSYQYNADGIRTQKYYNSNSAQTTYIHDYILDGSTILKETITSVTSTGGGISTLYYYDESGISGISYNGTKYSYIRNLQGDVIAIINSNGVTVVEYKYDAWGNILSVTGSLASTLGAVNPFRYRGYYYDTETGLYYLQSRYYDPQVGRFLNADEPILLGANGGIMGYNMFAYCNNNPVHFYDPSGAACICTKQRVPCNHTCTEYHVYTYTYRTGFLGLFKKTGRVYIYTGVTVSFFENAANHPADFNPETDVLVGDFTSDDNPNMYVYQAQKLKKKHRESVCEALLKYDKEYNTPWDRTLESLLSEWKSHHFFSWAAASAQNIDFDNKEEGMGFGHFLEKAVKRGAQKLMRKFIDRLIEYELWEEP